LLVTGFLRNASNTFFSTFYLTPTFLSCEINVGLVRATSQGENDSNLE